jgi:hypothetical protein
VCHASPSYDIYLRNTVIISHALNLHPKSLLHRVIYNTIHLQWRWANPQESIFLYQRIWRLWQDILETQNAHGASFYFVNNSFPHSKKPDDI